MTIHGNPDEEFGIQCYKDRGLQYGRKALVQMCSFFAKARNASKRDRVLLDSLEGTYLMTTILRL